MYQEVRLGDLSEVVTGTTPSTSEPTYYGGPIPFVTPAELDQVHPITSSNSYLSDEGVKRARLLPADSVLVCCIGSLGKVGIAGIPLVTNQQINALVLDKGSIHPRYALHACRQLKPILEAIAPSTTVKIVNKTRFSDLKIPLPTLPEQRRIAAILDQAEALRAKRRQAMAKFDTLTQSLFLEMFGDLQRKKSEMRPLSELLVDGDSINYGVVQPGDEYPGGRPLIRVGDFDNGRISTRSIKLIHPQIESAYKRSRLRGDEVLVSCVGSIGAIALVTPELAGFNIARAVARVPFDREKVNSLYLESYLRTPFVQRYFISELRTVTQPTLNIKQINETLVYVPPRSLQEEFASRRNGICSLEKSQVSSRDRIENAISSLQYRAFRGEL